MQPEISVSRDLDSLVRHFSTGQYVSVEIENHDRDRFDTTLIGIKPRQYLILELPSVARYGQLREELTLHKPIIIRTICEGTTGNCMGFRSRVDGTLRFPYPVFFVSFPEEVETRELRNEVRQPTLIAARMFRTDPNDYRNGTIVDLSAGGCRFELEVDDAVKGLKARLMRIQFTDPQSAAATTRLVKLCSQRRNGGKLAIGFAFMDGETGA